MARISGKLVTATLTILTLSACNKVNFTPVTSENILNGTDAVSSAPRCTTQVVDQAKAVQVLFLVDQSGSNLNGPFGFPGESTDPNKAFRFGIISNFLAQHGDKNNLRWSFITFNNGSANGLVNTGDRQRPVFSRDPMAIRNAFQNFFDAPDVGDTPYRSALRMAEDTIARDQQNKGLTDTLYLVALITDGHPTDYCAGGPLEKECPGRILENEIDADVSRLMAAAPGSVNLGTVYYGRKDTEASHRLHRMSQLGGGQFVDLNLSEKIDLNDVIQVPQTVCE